ncbi:hypothetical protein BS78_06G286800 [Paspalum vaginatum]|nr:hypothetical protein BS78_06G286800 [Paspalum vaginatum]
MHIIHLPPDKLAICYHCCIVLEINIFLLTEYPFLYFTETFSSLCCAGLPPANIGWLGRKGAKLNLGHVAFFQTQLMTYKTFSLYDRTESDVCTFLKLVAGFIAKNISSKIQSTCANGYS